MAIQIFFFLYDIFLLIVEKKLNYGKRVNEEKLVRVRELNEHE